MKNAPIILLIGVDAGTMKTSSETKAAISNATNEGKIIQDLKRGKPKRRKSNLSSMVGNDYPKKVSVDLSLVKVEINDNNKTYNTELENDTSVQSMKLKPKRGRPRRRKEKVVKVIESKHLGPCIFSDGLCPLKIEGDVSNTSCKCQKSFLGKIKDV